MKENRLNYKLVKVEPYGLTTGDRVKYTVTGENFMIKKHKLSPMVIVESEHDKREILIDQDDYKYFLKYEVKNGKRK